ncbi:hypothetical protein [Neoroseomonas oryzicola]|uniref:Uncharacterized protein n=3 Tax=Neoroseomonas oryzicola TaxID=535904 RepID=A0ABX1ENH4_9PROT|nr:hypothetical protein [Neoroseomonas oryzicola]NKE19346.1 hypothetical protein [Neoroseomonas oryzicola]
MNAARAGVLYGGLAFAAGAVLGPLRELLLAPRIGGLAAALAEAAAMAGLLWLAARRAVAGVEALRARAVVATLGLVVVLALEALLALAFDASGLAAARAPRGLAEQGIGVALLAWLFALPFLVRRHAVALP